MFSAPSRRSSLNPTSFIGVLASFHKKTLFISAATSGGKPTGEAGCKCYICMYVCGWMAGFHDAISIE